LPVHEVQTTAVNNTEDALDEAPQIHIIEEKKHEDE
jgi:hypothetical protein